MLPMQSSMCNSFGRICLYVCMYVCQMITFDCLPWRRKFIFAHAVYLSTVYGSSSYMKVIRSRSVTGAKNIEISYSCNVKLWSAITPILSNIERRAVMFACSIGFSGMADQMMRPSSLSHDQKWSHVTKCTHSQMVGLRLEGNLVNNCFGCFMLGHIIVVCGSLGD